MNKATLLRKQNSKGFSLIELLLVLGVIAALAIAAFVIYPKVTSANKAQTEANNINTIKAAVNALYTSAPDFDGLDTETAIKAKVFPDTMVSGTKAINSFKGDVTVEASDGGPVAGATYAFTIAYDGVPATECVKIVSTVGSNFYGIKVGETAVKEAGGSIKIADLSKACETGKNSNKIEFVGL